MIRVDVKTRSGRKQTDFHLKISPKPDVLKRPTKKGLSSMNVIMIGLDSTAHSHFQRKLGKVYKFLKDDIKLNRRVDPRPTKKGLSSMNVIMIGLDSTAHSHFQRKLGKVYKFLKDDIKSFIFNGYSIVGDGTTPALLALLTGKKEEELPEGRHRYLD